MMIYHWGTASQPSLCYPVAVNEQQIIPAIEEQANQAREREKAEFNTFISHWDIEDLPACPVGMALLKRFSETHPTMFQLVERTGFQDALAVRHPAFQSLQPWQEFVKHRAECHDCNEDGPVGQRYAGHR